MPFWRLYTYGAEITRGLRALHLKVDALHSLMGQQMAKIDDVRTKAAAIQSGLDKIQADGQRLRDLILSGQKGLNETEADEALGILDSIQGRVNAIDEENPEPSTDTGGEPA